MAASKGKAVPIAVAVVALAGAVVLNPSAERHRAQIRDTVAERSTVARVLKIGSMAAFAARYHTVGLASYTTAGERVLSVGALGLVHVVD